MLARREYFRTELERKGWLSNTRAAQSLVTTRQRRFGAGRIVAELEQRGAGDEEIQSAAQVLRGGEVERAKSVWRRRFRAFPTSPEERAKQSRFLAGRGFSAEVIAQVFRAEDE